MSTRASLAPSLSASPGRIASMDQFRGYTVAGMFLVNFVGSLAAFHAVLKHHNVYFSYADAIMPSFIFAVGFSYRLTILKRLPQLGAIRTYFTYFKRSLGLILVSLMVFSFGNGFNKWEDFSKVPEVYAGPPIEATARDEADSKVTESGKKKDDPFKVEIPEHFGLNWKMFALKVIKADLWEVLSIIAVTQIFILPVIATRWWIRLLALLACGAGHAYITHWFNWDFLYGIKDATVDGELLKGSWMNEKWGISGVRVWDGGCFGIVSWAVAMLAGSLVYDLVSSRSAKKACGRLLLWGVLMMGLGYGMSCLSRLYDLEPIPGVTEIAKINKQLEADTNRIKKDEAAKLKALSELPKEDSAKEEDSDDSDAENVEQAEQIKQQTEQIKNDANADIEKITGESKAKIAEIQEQNKDGVEAAEATNKERLDPRTGDLASSPVIPPFERANGRPFTKLLAEAPFLPPPTTKPGALKSGKPVRLKNY